MSNLNMQRFWEGLSALAMSAVTAYLLLTQKFIALVHPRHEIFLWIFAVILFLWSINSFYLLTKQMYKKQYLHCLTLLIPFLFLALPLATGTVYSQAALPEDVAPQKETFGYKLEEVAGNGFIIEDKLVLLNSKNFYRSIIQLTKRIDDFQDHEIIFTGYVSRHDKTLPPKDFTLSRVLMICCAADVAPYGIACHYEGPLDLKDGQWITVRGTIKKRNFYGQQHPLVIVEDVLPAEKIPGYVYP